MGLEFAGKTFGGYRVGDVLDSGAHGALHVAEHTSSGDKVAIKIFAADLSRDKNAAARLVSDVQRAVAVAHPNILPVREVGTAEFKGKRHLFVAMERLPGESLKSLLAKQKGQPLPLRQALHILSEVGAALEAIHRSNGVHRQLHSGAVFIAPSEGESDDSRVLVLDLGAALVPSGDDKKAKVGGKVQDDLRALAQLAYELLGGGEIGTDSGQAILPLRLRNRAVPARMDAVLRSVLSDVLGSGDKGSRYDSAAAFIAALLGTGETQPRFASWSEDGRTLPAPRKSHSTLLWAGLFAVAGGLALGYHLFTSDPGTQPGGSMPPVTPNPVTNRLGTATDSGSTTAVDAGSDAGSAVPVGPGHWPQRPGGKVPDVRPADAWPAPAAAPSPSTPQPAATPSPAAAKEPTIGAAAEAAKPAALAAGTPASAPTGAVAPAAKPTAAPTGAPQPTAGAKPAATGMPPAASGAATPAGTSPATKPAASPASAASAAVPAAKPAVGPAVTPAAANPTAKPAAPTTPASAATPAGAKPAASSTSAPTGTAGGPASAKPPASPATPAPTMAKPAATPGAATPATAKPAATPGAATPATAKPAATPGAATPATAAKPAAPGAVPAASPAAPRSPSAPAAPAGAASAAKTPETRPSSTGGSTPAAKPATGPGGASGPQ